MAEEKVLKLQQFKCPACNYSLTKFSSLAQTITCPRCGAVSKNPLITAKQIPVPERIIPFTTDEGNFEQAMVKALVEQDYADKNIFSGINTDNVFRVYLPMFLYEGTYNSSWSCESSYQDKEVSISRNWTDSGKTVSTKNVKKWRPQNGTATGNFAFLCLANEGSKDVPDELRDFTRNVPYDVMSSCDFNDEYLTGDDNLVTVEMNADKAQIWQQHGKEKVDQTAEEAAMIQLGDQEIRNFRASSSFQLANKGEYVLAPFWFVYYTYNNERYHFLMDGVGNRISYTYPVDQDDVDFVNGKEKIKTIVKWLWPLALVLGYIFSSFTATIVLFVAWLIGKIVTNKMMNSQIQSRLNESRAARESAAARL